MGRTLEDYSIQNRAGVKELKVDDGVHDDDYIRNISNKLKTHNVDIIAASMLGPTIIAIMDNSVLVPITLTAINARLLAKYNTRVVLGHVIAVNVLIIVMRFSRLGFGEDIALRIAIFCIIVLLSASNELIGIEYIIPAALSIF